METKKCKDCNEIKSTSEFYKSNKYLNSYCKICSSMRFNKCSREEAIDRLNKVNERKILITIGKRKCSICNIIKENSDYFHCKDRHGKNRLRSFCKECDHIVRQKSRKKLRCANRFNDLLAKIKTKCKRKSILFNLTLDYLNELYQKQDGKCSLTGIPFQSSEITTLSPYTLSIDRIIPKKGYTINNVRLVLYAMNCALNKWGEDVFEALCKAYLENKK